MQATEVDRVRPSGPWRFDAEVAACFDDMLRRSIPDYDGMRSACLRLGSRYVKPKTDIVDLGCSRGEALAPFVDRFGAFNRYVGVEASAPMADAARARLSGHINCGLVDIREQDLRGPYPPARASLTLCVLTLQFVPLEHRLRVVRDAFRSTVPGGALLLVEKVLGDTADLDASFVEEHHAMKEAAGYAPDDVARKRLSLEGVLVPVTARWNEEMLRGAGFAEVDCFWRYLNFAGWVAVRS